MPTPEHQDDHYTLGSPDEAVIYVLQNRGKLDGDAGRLAMARRNRANTPAAGRKTALNGQTPCILSLPENFYNYLFAIYNQTPHYSSVRNPGRTRYRNYARAGVIRCVQCDGDTR